MNNILIIAGRYLPGYKDGGPVRTIKNLTDLLGSKYHFTVACADRDHEDTKPYEGIMDGLNRVGKADVFYVDNGRFTFSIIKRLVKENNLVYVCGPYNGYAIKALILNRLGLIKVPFVLAPMGSFSKGALAIKSSKKKLFFILVKFLGLFKNVLFSVTSAVEEEELKYALGLKNKCYIARDPQRAIDESLRHDYFKRDGKLHVVFLSRISEKKNLDGAIEILSKVKGNVVFDIYGNIEDKDYYNKCERMLKELPCNINWEYKGLALSEEVPSILSNYDVFLFPTHGENFGHVISEALSAGTIPVISDTTPWLDLNRFKAGYVIDHDDINKFVTVIDNMCNMSENEIKTLSDNSYEYYKRDYEHSIDHNGYSEMFDELL